MMISPVAVLTRLVLLALAVLGGAHAAGPLSPAASLDDFVLPDGLRIELVAAEPLVNDPVALCFGARGALYVVENRGYPESTEQLGRVALLRDADGDGYFESRSTFAEGFDFPNGIMAWRNGVLLTAAPEVLYLEDTGGDDIADKREVVLSGFAEGGSTQLRVSHPTLGLDNWIHFTNGLSGGKVQIGEGGAGGPLDMGAYDLRFDPFGQRLATEAGRGQFGLAFDDWGNAFVCSNRNHIQHAVMQPADLARNPRLGLSGTVADIPDHGAAAEIYALSDARTTAYAHAGTFTAACGLVIYRGDALPPEYRGNAFVCEPTGALVHRDVLTPKGATFNAARGREGVEFLASPDNWFRPVFLANGPDGALYLCDMYRETIEHPTYLPPEVAAVTDFMQGTDRGRIYRITADSTKPDTAGTDADALIAQLASPRSWVRETAHRLLLETQDASIAPALRAAFADSESALARAHALRLLDGLGALAPDDLRKALSDVSPRVREHAVCLLRLHPEWHGALGGELAGLARESDAQLRFDAALALGDLEDTRYATPLAAIAREDVGDPWARVAVLSSIAGNVAAFTQIFAKDLPEAAPGLPEMLQHLARLLALSDAAAETPGFLTSLLADDSTDAFASRAAAVHGAASVMRLAALTADDAPLAAQINALIAHALHVSADATADAAVRAQAIALLGDAPFAQTGDALAALLTPLTPPALQVDAVRALGGMADDAVAARLAEPVAWAAYTPPVKAAAMQALLKRSERLDVLLRGIEQGEIAAWSVDPVNRSRLQGHGDTGIRDRARVLFANLKRTDRSAVFEEYKPVLELTPDPVHGREVFQNICSRCHLFNDDGYEVGPDLSGIRSQPLESILLHILVPNSLMLPGYETYIVETRDFESFSGIIVAESGASITLRQGLGIEETIARAEIDKMEATGLSMMPEELEKGMTRQELRDLLGYLKGE